MYDFIKLKEDLIKYNLELADEKIDKLNRYYEMLVEKNKVMNLTAITEFDEVLLKHFLDSLSICQVYDLSSQKKVIDVGTGAGLPGLVLAIVFDDSEFTLTDSLLKRLKFIDEVVSELNLLNVKTIHGRAEDLGHQKVLRETFDLCVSRAVANLSTLCEYTIPFVKVGGKLISYKSGDVDTELSEAKNAIKILGGESKELFRFSLSDTDILRSFVIIEKIKSTSKNYPRKAGMPSKEPLRG